MVTRSVSTHFPAPACHVGSTYHRPLTSSACSVPAQIGLARPGLLWRVTQSFTRTLVQPLPVRPSWPLFSKTQRVRTAPLPRTFPPIPCVLRTVQAVTRQPLQIAAAGCRMPVLPFSQTIRWGCVLLPLLETSEVRTV